MANSIKSLVRVADKTGSLFPILYCALRTSLEHSETLKRFTGAEVVILFLLEDKGGSAERPLIWKPLGLTAQKYAHVIKRLKKQELIYNPPRTGRTATDRITHRGRQKLQEIREELNRVLIDVFRPLSNEEAATVLTAFETLETVARKWSERN